MNSAITGKIKGVTTGSTTSRAKVYVIGPHIQYSGQYLSYHRKRYLEQGYPCQL